MSFCLLSLGLHRVKSVLESDEDGIGIHLLCNVDKIRGQENTTTGNKEGGERRERPTQQQQRVAPETNTNNDTQTHTQCESV